MCIRDSSYGIWLFAAKWGITPGDRARKRFGYVCAVIGITLCLMGFASIYAFVGNPAYANAPADVLPDSTTTITQPASANPPLGSSNPSQPGEAR